MYTKIQQLCEERNISVYRLEKEMKFSSGSMRKWAKSMPAVDKINRVAEYFNVPITYFIS
jgi:transcriptional regulator with XRE-family HTH domain